LPVDEAGRTQIKESGMKRTNLSSTLVALLLGLLAVLPLAAGGAREATAPRESMIIGMQSDPPTLDVHVSPNVYNEGQFFGASLIIKDPATNQYAPYLAKEWSVSADGLVFSFTLRDDIFFHDGSKLTAADYAWTFNRAISVPVKSTAGATLLNVKEAVATGPYTFEIRLSMPNWTLLDVLSRPTYHQPLSKAYVEAKGDAFGRNPVSVGPYKFKEWVTGSKLVLERNTAFTWGPAFTKGQPPRIQTLEFRYIPEYATRLAGLEAGEIDFMRLESRDVARFEQSDKFQLFKQGDVGSGYVILMNLTKEPFTDLRFRQALNYAVDKTALVRVVFSGQAEVSHGPITRTTHGYWDGVEGISYKTDTAKAKALLAEMGYSAGTDGIMQKGGVKLSLVLDVLSDQTRMGEILQQQLKAAGIDVTLRQKEMPVLYADMAKGDFQFAVNRYGWQDYGLMFAMFHPAMIGNMNHSQQSQDAALAQYLGGMAFGPSVQVSQALIVQSQKHLVEQAYSVPLVTEHFTYALNKRIRDAVFHINAPPFIFDAYIQN
jgi:peptide/nickel transport system substrate-binding protein